VCGVGGVWGGVGGVWVGGGGVDELMNPDSFV